MNSAHDDPTSPLFYDESYYRHKIHGHHWFRDNERKHRARWDAMLRAVDPSPSDTVLDIGCADGRHAAQMTSHVKRVIGVDFSKAAIDIATSRYEDHDRIEFMQADATELSMLGSESIDKVMAIDFFEHIDDQALMQVVSEAWRVLRPGGRLVFYTPCASHYVERMKARNFILKQLPGHIAVRDGPAYRELLSSMGWRSLEINYLPSDYPLVGMIDRIMLHFPVFDTLFRFRVIGVLVKP